MADSPDRCNLPNCSVQELKTKKEEIKKHIKEAKRREVYEQSRKNLQNLLESHRAADGALVRRHENVDAIKRLEGQSTVGQMMNLHKLYFEMDVQGLMDAYDYHVSKQRKLVEAYFRRVSNIMGNTPRNKQTQKYLGWELAHQGLPNLHNVLEDVQDVRDAGGKSRKGIMSEFEAAERARAQRPKKKMKVADEPGPVMKIET